MIWNEHSILKDKHALLSPSGYYWLNDDEEKLANRISSLKAAEAGTIIHDLACRLIKHRIKINKNDRHLLQLALYEGGIPPKTIDITSALYNLLNYVNDAIGFHMDPEITLFYSENIFGTADAISYKNNTLRIHDLKTGKIAAKMDQLLIYAGLFFLEYNKILNFDLSNLNVELRIYQNEEIIVHTPEIDEMAHYIDMIIEKNKMLQMIL